MAPPAGSDDLAAALIRLRLTAFRLIAEQENLQRSAPRPRSLWRQLLHPARWLRQLFARVRGFGGT